MTTTEQGLAPPPEEGDIRASAFHPMFERLCELARAIDAISDRHDDDSLLQFMLYTAV